MRHDGAELRVRVGEQQPVGELVVHVQVRALPEKLDRGVEVVEADPLDVDQLRGVRGFGAQQPLDLLLAGRSRKILAQDVLKKGNASCSRPMHLSMT